MWYSDIKKIYKVGPYSTTHGTNGTMAYTKAYKERHIYDEYVINAEESSFTGGFKEKMVQLDPFQVILVTSHSQNTFDKRGLRGGNKLIQPTEQTIDTWIKNPELRDFFENCWEHLQRSKQLSDTGDAGAAGGGAATADVNAGATVHGAAGGGAATVAE